MSSFNKVILLGNLTRDPELRYTPKGAAVAQLGLAVNRKYSTQEGEQREEVTFVEITAWGKQAEVIAQYCKKGRPLFVEGRLKLDQWDDKNTGKKMSKLGVVLESFQFLGNNGERQETGDYDREQLPTRGGPPTAGAPRRPAAPAAPAPDHDGPPPEDDDVPF